jgi:metal-responsive CopG/Arc/MetJ family transcriptional regulator
MTQLVARVDDDLVAEVDRMVADGIVESRSAAVRDALRMLIDRRRRERTGAAIVEGYRRVPQEPDGWDDAATAAMIGEEPW